MWCLLWPVGCKRGKIKVRPKITLLCSYRKLLGHFLGSWHHTLCSAIYSSVSQPPGRDPVPGSGINYNGPQEVLLEFVILDF